MPTQLETVITQSIDAFMSAHQGFWLKLPPSVLVGAATFFIGVDNTESMVALAMLACVDLVTAIGAAYKKGEKIESRKILKTAVKLVVYTLMVGGAHLAEEIAIGSTFLDSTAVSFLALTELVSVLENVGKMGYAVPQKLLNMIDEIKDKKK